jgi:hypothetical protein
MQWNQIDAAQKNWYYWLIMGTSIAWRNKKVLYASTIMNPPAYMFDEQHTCSLSSESICAAAMEEDKDDGDVPRHQWLGMAPGDAGWYLSANGKKTHGLIVAAFVDTSVERG